MTTMTTSSAAPVNSTTTAHFGQYEVILELFEEDGQQRSYCDIINLRTQASASLAAADGEGYLLKSNGSEERIANPILDTIAHWAEENGY